MCFYFVAGLMITSLLISCGSDDSVSSRTSKVFDVAQPFKKNVLNNISLIDTCVMEFDYGGLKHPECRIGDLKIRMVSDSQLMVNQRIFALDSINRQRDEEEFVSNTAILYNVKTFSYQGGKYLYVDVLNPYATGRGFNFPSLFIFKIQQKSVRIQTCYHGYHTNFYNLLFIGGEMFVSRIQYQSTDNDKGVEYYQLEIGQIDSTSLTPQWRALPGFRIVRGEDFEIEKGEGIYSWLNSVFAKYITPGFLFDK